MFDYESALVKEFLTLLPQTDNSNVITKIDTRHGNLVKVKEDGI